jgi:hypothetical protein
LSGTDQSQSARPLIENLFHQRSAVEAGQSIVVADGDLLALLFKSFVRAPFIRNSAPTWPTKGIAKSALRRRLARCELIKVTRCRQTSKSKSFATYKGLWYSLTSGNDLNSSTIWIYGLRIRLETDTPECSDETTMRRKRINSPSESPR